MWAWTVVLLGVVVGLAILAFWPSATDESTADEQQERPDHFVKPARPAEVHYLGPDEFYLNQAAYTRDESGRTKLNTVLLPHLPEKQSALHPPSSGGYLGPEACQECHAANHASFRQTSHAKTSAFASTDTILGSFESGKNQLKTKSPDLTFEMLSRDGKLWQRMLVDGQGTEEPLGAEFPIDMVTGSGKVGQTYLYWNDEFLYQLHASYLSMTDSWMNSPGYEDGVANFARPVLSFCLECHTTYTQPVENTANQYLKQHMVLGVTCEKCHGPGAEHVEFHRANPKEKNGKHIVNPADLPTQRSLELCQLCHGGTPEAQLKPAFEYRPGDDLSQFYQFAESTGAEVSHGIHTNSQLPRLQQSQCFIKSEAMTCIDCHDPHQFERGDMELFSERCITCHEPKVCGQYEQLGERLRENCIDCHMRSFEVDDIKLFSQGQQHVPTMRDHYIKAWPEATAEYLRRINEDQP